MRSRPAAGAGRSPRARAARPDQADRPTKTSSRRSGWRAGRRPERHGPPAKLAHGVGSRAMDRATVGRPTANHAQTCSSRSAILWRLVIVLALSLAPASIASAQSACTFILGFATLHDLIPNVVGNCIDDESHDPQTGDALQHTT